MTTKVLKTTPRLIKPIESQDEPREDAKLNHITFCAFFGGASLSGRGMLQGSF
jgi:hypothetical protein